MRTNVVSPIGKSSMHTQHVKFSTYVLGGGGEDGVVDAVADSLPSLSFLFFGSTGDEPAAAAVVVAVVAAIVVVAVVVVVVVSPAPSLSPAASSLFESSSCFFLGKDAFFSASAAAFNRLHCRLCPPSFQCFIWHSLLQ